MPCSCTTQVLRMERGVEWRRETTAFVVVVPDVVVMSTFTSNHTASSAYLVGAADGYSALTLFNSFFFC